MSSNVSSRQGPYSSLGSKGVIEVPRSIVKLSVNMGHILDGLTHDDSKQKRAVLAGATVEIHKTVEELARKKENLEHGLGKKIAQLHEELQDACKKFNGKVAGIKEDLEKKGIHDLDSTPYTSDEIFAIVERLKRGH